LKFKIVTLLIIDLYAAIWLP